MKIKITSDSTCDLSAELIMNIFFPNASLHDGAMLVSDFRIHAAGCLLPLSPWLPHTKPRAPSPLLSFLTYFLCFSV